MDADLLDDVLIQTTDYSPDLKALMLRMIHQQAGDVEAVATQKGLSLSTIYQWLSRWNQQQQDLKKSRTRPGPDQSAGARAPCQGARRGVSLGAWRTHLQTQPVQHWTADELAKVFVEKGGLRYCHSHWSTLLREREGMYFYKPHPRDYRPSEDAPEQLADRIEATFDALQAMGYDLERVRWGFADDGQRLFFFEDFQYHFELKLGSEFALAFAVHGVKLGSKSNLATGPKKRAHYTP